MFCSLYLSVCHAACVFQHGANKVFFPLRSGGSSGEVSKGNSPQHTLAQLALLSEAIAPSAGSASTSPVV